MGRRIQLCSWRSTIWKHTCSSEPCQAQSRSYVPRLWSHILCCAVMVEAYGVKSVHGGRIVGSRHWEESLVRKEADRVCAYERLETPKMADKDDGWTLRTHLFSRIHNGRTNSNISLQSSKSVFLRPFSEPMCSVRQSPVLVRRQSSCCPLSSRSSQLQVRPACWSCATRVSWLSRSRTNTHVSASTCQR